MEELFTSFMWTKVRRENVPAENMQSFLTFENKKLKHKLFYAHLSIHRYKTNYKGKKSLWAEEAICEFATHLNSPVKDELFYAIVNDDVEDVELMFQICSTIIHL